MAQGAHAKYIEPPSIPPLWQWRNPDRTRSISAKKIHKDVFVAPTQQAQGVKLASKPLADHQHAFRALNDALVALFRTPDDSHARKHQSDHCGRHGQCDQQLQQGKTTVSFSKRVGHGADL
ncbi:hypothetical protein D3C87_1763790 [compost metagenome]